MSADGIGAYFAPQAYRPVRSGGVFNAPLRPGAAAGLGAYYSPSPLRPVKREVFPGPGATAGFGALDERAKSQMGIVVIIGLIAVGYLWWQRKELFA